MKKIIISIIAIILLSVIVLSNVSDVYAIDIKNPEAYIQGGTDHEALVPIGNTIVGIVRAVGIALSTLILVIIGIKYILGSAQEKAEYKQTMWPYLLGAVLIFAGSQVTNIIYMAVISGN